MRKPGLWCMNQGLREGELFELVGRLMVGGGGLGLLGWINTIDTKGLASRDLLFLSNLPSISLNPTTTTSLARLCFIFCWGYKKRGVGGNKMIFSQTCDGQVREEGKA